MYSRGQGQTYSKTIMDLSLLNVTRFPKVLSFIYLIAASGVEASRGHAVVNVSSFESELPGASTTEYDLVIDTATSTLPPVATEVIIEEYTTESQTASTRFPETTENALNYIVRAPDRNGCDCGVPKMKFLQSTTRIIGGQPTILGEFPWFGAVTKFQHNKVPRWKVVCGSALINEEYALTAAHCLHKYIDRYKDTLEVVFNIRDVHNITTDPGVIRNKIKEFFIHPHYDTKTQHDDIALIRLKNPINLRQERRVTPICLPRKDARNMYANRNGTFVGFGHQYYGSSNPGPKENSRTLMKVNVPIYSHADCLRSKVPTKKNITENMVCAGSQGKDGCINDSGGPLQFKSGGRTILVGLASWGVGCGLADYPGVYTRVSQYLTWVRTISGAQICS